MGYLLNGVLTEGLPDHIVKIFTNAYDVTTFVETGTAGAASITKASELFKKCHTIELIDGRVDEKIKENVFYDNVTFHTGNSVEILPEIISTFTEEYVLFFLDAHYSDPEPNVTGVKECPVMEEIKIISEYRKSIILIDDARLFLGSPPYPLDPREWPMVQDIFALTKELFIFHYTTIIDDYILCYPHEMAGAVESEWTKRFFVRYPTEKDKLKTEAKHLYAAFKNYVNV